MRLADRLARWLAGRLTSYRRIAAAATAGLAGCVSSSDEPNIGCAIRPSVSRCQGHLHTYIHACMHALIHGTADDGASLDEENCILTGLCINDHFSKLVVHEEFLRVA